MSKDAPQPAAEAGRKRSDLPPPPVDEWNGIPDRAPSARRWRWALLAGGFLLWVAFLAYCAAAGSPGR
jgi:hypothetical protein